MSSRIDTRELEMAQVHIKDAIGHLESHDRAMAENSMELARRCIGYACALNAMFAEREKIGAVRRAS